MTNTFTSRCLSKRRQGFASPDSKKYTDRCMAESLRYSHGTITTLLIQNIFGVKKRKEKTYTEIKRSKFLTRLGQGCLSPPTMHLTGVQIWGNRVSGEMHV